MERLDIFLVNNNYFSTRKKAQDAIRAGNVFVNNICQKKCSEKILDMADIVVKDVNSYVSRAGKKLEFAKQQFNLNFFNKVVLDVGASTGGFTDFCLQNGAKKVYAIDVGTGQLDAKLAVNNKVVNLEKTDFRTINCQQFCDVDIVVCDVSFISLKLLVPKFSELLKSGQSLVCLIKPQFECGKQLASKFKGVIRDKKIHQAVVRDVVDVFKQAGFVCNSLCDSPILGTDGNKEFLVWLVKQ